MEKQRSKLKEQIPAEKLAKSRKFRLIEKELDKRKRKYTEARLKATRARNEYLLCMEAGNASLHKYYVDDLSDMLDCMDYGLHQSLARQEFLPDFSELSRSEKSTKTGTKFICIGDQYHFIKCPSQLSGHSYLWDNHYS